MTTTIKPVTFHSMAAVESVTDESYLEEKAMVLCEPVKPEPAQAQPQPPMNQVLEKFRRIEHNFNKNFLIILYQVKQIVEGEDDAQDLQQYTLLQAAYTKWYQKLQTDPRCMDACMLFYESVKDYHELLLKRDTQLFTVNGDFFSNVFDQTGLNTPYLFDQLRDGLESDSDDDEEEEKVSAEEKDAKDNMWSSIIGLYRLCVLICIYLKMPLVKEIIDMILINNPDLNQSNIFEKIFKEFKGKRRLRKMIMKLLKSKGDSFGDIFSSLQKVIATFGPEVNMDTNMKKNMEMAKTKVRSLFEGVLKQAGVTGLNEEQTNQLIEALEEKNQVRMHDFVEEKLITAEQVDKIDQLYREQGLDKMNVTKVVKDLGHTMEEMMAAIESNDENAVKAVLSKAGAGLNLDPAEMERMQSEMEKFEKESDNDSDFSEDSDEGEDNEDIEEDKAEEVSLPVVSEDTELAEVVDQSVMEARVDKVRREKGLPTLGQAAVQTEPEVKVSTPEP